MATKLLGGYGGNGRGKFKVVKMGSGKSYRQLAPSGFARGGVFSDHGGLYNEASASDGGILKGFASGGQMRRNEIGVVGENGPELFFAGSHGGYVMPNGGSSSKTTQVIVPDGSGGGDIHVHIHGDVYTKSSTEFRKMVVTSIEEAKRKGEIRK